MLSALEGDLKEKSEAPPAVEPAGTPAGGMPYRKAAGDENSTALVRKKIPRTFNRRPRQWLNVLLEMPDVTSESFVALRHGVLNLSRSDVSRLLRVARNTVWDWETGYRSAPFSAFLALTLLRESQRLVDSVDPWRRAPLSGAADARMLSGLRELQPVAPLVDDLLPRIDRASRAGRRGRILLLQERMKTFSSIYNAAWHVRDAWHGSELRRQEVIWRFVQVLVCELRQCRDFEALIYAVADALYASPQGVPWEP
jgi:DNA-binding transcriptional regulator YiaG